MNYVIARNNGWRWSKRNYWTIVENKFRVFKAEKTAEKFMLKNGMADRIDIPVKIDTI